MGHSAVAIANEFLRRRGSPLWPQQMLIQKLAYIANGWYLAIDGSPLITEPSEAWDNGPVYRSIWDHIKEYGYRGENFTLTDPVSKKPITEPLNDLEEAVIDHVWKKYGSMPSDKLSRLTHEPDTPWSKAYFKRGRNSYLDNNEIKEHYTALAMAGRGG